MNLIISFFIYFGNVWIWKIFSENLLIGIVVILASFFLYRSFKSEKISISLVLIFSVLLVFQFVTTKKEPLDSLTQQEKIFQIQRMKEYPPVFIKIAGKTIWIPAAHWLEERKETLAFYRIEKNFSEVLSPNLYFFANHPNERVGIKEFEKFPYILLPFFLIGFLNIGVKRNIKAIFISLFAPLILFGIFGNNNLLSSFSLFPFIAVISILGLGYVFKSFQKLKIGNKKFIVPIAFCLLYLLVFLQAILYEKF